MRLWDLGTGEQIGSSLEGHTYSVYCVAFSPNGLLLASASSDHTVRLWNARTGEAVGVPLRAYTGIVNSVSFSPNGHSLVSSGDDAKIFVYDTPSTPLARSELARRWLACCSSMDVRDGWIKDGNSLLLWVPSASRGTIQSCARMVIDRITPRATVFSINYGVLFQYVGPKWTTGLSNM